jgi:hypothetical protein
VEIVLYRRAAVRLFGSFVPASQVASRLDAARAAGKLAPGNGSALDEGARVAAAALATRTGALRLVVTTDSRLRSRYRNDLGLAALAAVPAGAVVHVVEARSDGGAVSMTRDDQHGLAPLALAHHGIGAVVDGLGAADKHLPERILGLVRPVRIDHFEIVGLDLEHGKYDQVLPDTLEEGAGRPHRGRPHHRADLGRADRHDLGRQVPSGRHVGRRVLQGVGGVGLRRGRSPGPVARGDADGGEAGAGGVAGDVVPGDRARGAAVGDRPRGGARRHRLGVRDGRARHVGQGRDAGAAAGSDDAPLARAAAACVKQHQPAAGWAVHLDMETTGHEIVDVVPGAGAATPVGACLVEAVWALPLPTSFVADRAMHPLDFR